MFKEIYEEIEGEVEEGVEEEVKEDVEEEELVEEDGKRVWIYVVIIAGVLGILVGLWFVFFRKK